VNRALLVAHQNVADVVLLKNLVINGQHSPAGIAEYRIDALIAQRLDHHSRTRHLSGHIRHLFCQLAAAPRRIRTGFAAPPQIMGVAGQGQCPFFLK